MAKDWSFVWVEGKLQTMQSTMEWSWSCITKMEIIILSIMLSNIVMFEEFHEIQFQAHTLAPKWYLLRYIFMSQFLLSHYWNQNWTLSYICRQHIQTLQFIWVKFSIGGFWLDYEDKLLVSVDMWSGSNSIIGHFLCLSTHCRIWYCWFLWG
jgi:hypothetical protein